ncbi:MAG TPA: glycosyltransferase family 2 protein [Patescibacteria group bacterium]|nr:glycosyltransferase family 2 protein [Patescibacteria group bacterium]
MPETPATIIAVIPCLNEERHIARLVRALVADRGDLPMTIVIADGGSSDATPDIARKLADTLPDVRYLHNPKRLQSAAVNLAAQSYGDEARYLIRIDAHADYPPDYCRALVGEAEALGADSVVVTMKTAGTGLFQRAAAAAQNSLLGNGGAAHRNAAFQGKWVEHGHHALMRLDAFRAVGGYDENFPTNEDAELDIRLRRAGYRIWLTAQTAVTYFPREKPAALLRQYFRFGQGRARTIAKHRVLPRLRQVLPLAVAPAALMLPLALLHWIFAVPFLTWALLCLGYGALLGLRARDAAAMLSGFAAMLMHLGWSFGFGAGLLGRMAR